MRDWVARQNQVSVWERPMPTGAVGAPQRVDVSLFGAGTEWRLEIGEYSKTKLKKDSVKLWMLRNQVHPGFPALKNILLLWNVHDRPLTKGKSDGHMSVFKTDAGAVTQALPAAIAKAKGSVAPPPAPIPSVEVLMSSAVDLFRAEKNTSRYAVVSVFEVQ